MSLRLRLGERRLAFARGEDVGGRQRVGAAEAAVEMDAFDREPEKGEIGEVGVKLRLRVALQISGAGARIRRPLDPAVQRDARVVQRVAPLRLLGQQQGRARSPRRDACVWRASVDMRKSGAPSKSLATPTRVVSGAPVAGSSVASAAVRESRMSRFASATASA